MGLLQKYVLDGMSRNDVIKNAIRKVRELGDVVREDFITKNLLLNQNICSMTKSEQDACLEVIISCFFSASALGV